MPYAKRTVLDGFPKVFEFQTRGQVDAYLGDKKIQCLLCGHKFRLLEPHLSKVHEISGDQYREMYALPYKRGLCCAGFSESRSENSKRMVAENRERQMAALEAAQLVQRINGNPQRQKPKYWKAEVKADWEAWYGRKRVTDPAG